MFDISLFYDFILFNLSIFCFSFSFLLETLSFSNIVFFCLWIVDFTNFAFLTVVSTGFISEIYIADSLNTSEDICEAWRSNWAREFSYKFLFFCLLLFFPPCPFIYFYEVYLLYSERVFRFELGWPLVIKIVLLESASSNIWDMLCESYCYGSISRDELEESWQFFKASLAKML